MNREEARGLINGNVRGLKAYHLEPENVPVKLNQNENPFDWPASVKEEVADFCRSRPWNRYPNFIPETLKAALASYAGISSPGVLVGNGSNEILLVLLLSLVKHGTPVVICQPTFTVYKLLVDGMGARGIYIPLTSLLEYDVDAICSTLVANPGAVAILCSPNNPTGCALSQAQIRRILDVHTGFIILDQAYVEFGGFNAVSLLREYPNLLIARTFSKAFAGAGLRLGYLLGDPSVIAEINKIKLPYNINFFSEHVATVLMNNRDLQQKTVGTIIDERDSLDGFLRTQPFENVYSSSANFILIRSIRAKDLFEFLRTKGILVRDVSGYPMLDNCLRISVGTPEENNALKNAARTFFEG